MLNAGRPTPTVLRDHGGGHANLSSAAADRAQYFSLGSSCAAAPIAARRAVADLPVPRCTRIVADAAGDVPIELRFPGIERGGDDDQTAGLPLVSVKVVNRKTGRRSAPVSSTPRPTATSPCRCPGRRTSPAATSMSVVLRARRPGITRAATDVGRQLGLGWTHSFAVNLVKSLLDPVADFGAGGDRRDLLQHVPLLADRGRADAGDPAGPLGRGQLGDALEPGRRAQRGQDFRLQRPGDGKRSSARRWTRWPSCSRRCRDVLPESRSSR